MLKLKKSELWTTLIHLMKTITQAQLSHCQQWKKYHGFEMDKNVTFLKFDDCQH